MDRRTFTRVISAAGLGLLACDSGAPPTGPALPEPPVAPPPPPPPPLPPPPPELQTADERAADVARGLLAAAQPYGDMLRWQRVGSSPFPLDLYSGQAGVVLFLAEAYRHQPGTELRTAVERGGRYLLQAPPLSNHSLYEGNAGLAWTFLTLHDVLGDVAWLNAALARSAPIATSAANGDLIAGGAGRGLYLLRLHERTADARWLDAARRLGDGMIAGAVASGAGLKFPSFNLPDGQTVFYPGLAHGAAGAGYFLARLAKALPGPERVRYQEGAEAAAAWLDDVAIENPEGVNWYRREPDQMDVQQVQWCHGAPGIGIFYAELAELTGRGAHLDTALAAARTVERLGSALGSTSLCHGVAGNGALFLKLHRLTADPYWLGRARGFGETVWERRLPHVPHAAWRSADGYNANNPGLLNATAGPGWYFLQLAQDGGLGMPITD